MVHLVSLLHPLTARKAACNKSQLPVRDALHASRPSCCTQRWTFIGINWRLDGRSSVEIS